VLRNWNLRQVEKQALTFGHGSDQHFQPVMTTGNPLVMNIGNSAARASPPVLLAKKIHSADD
jgi:hypothetical protein